MPTVRIEPSGLEAHLAEGEPVLSGLFRCGFTVRQVGCRRGGCGICKLELLAGEVSYQKLVADTVLSPAERADSVCLTCRAVPVGDITLHIDVDDVREAPTGLLRYLNVSGPTGGQNPDPAAPPASTTGPATSAGSKREY